jgi:hypothetical protein
MGITSLGIVDGQHQKNSATIVDHNRIAMTFRDIYADVLRERGMNKRDIQDSFDYADSRVPVGTEKMNMEVPTEFEQSARDMLREVASILFDKIKHNQ